MAPIYLDDTDTLTEDLGGGQYRHTQDSSFLMEATEEGPNANTPFFTFATQPYVFEFLDELPAELSSLTLVSSQGIAAGGSLGVSDPTLRVQAKASYLGQFGPSDQALIAGAYSYPGVAHVALAFDSTNAVTYLYVADESWAAGAPWAQRIRQHLHDRPWVGFGARVGVLSVLNQPIAVQATVLLADPALASETSDIAKNVRRELRSYFDDRPDWYTWRINSIASTITRSDSRIRTATSVVVLDEDASPMGEPAATLAALPGTATHYMLADDAVRLTFTTPS